MSVITGKTALRNGTLIAENLLSIIIMMQSIRENLWLKMSC